MNVKKGEKVNYMYLIIYQDIGAGFSVGDDIGIILLGRDRDRIKIGIEMDKNVTVEKKRGKMIETTRQEADDNVANIYNIKKSILKSLGVINETTESITDSFKSHNGDNYIGHKIEMLIADSAKKLVQALRIINQQSNPKETIE